MIKLLLIGCKHKWCLSPLFPAQGPLLPDWNNKDWSSINIKTGILKMAGAFLVAQIVKNLPVMQETRVQSLGQEDPLEKKTATPSSILAWRIPWTEEPGRLQSMRLQRIGIGWAINTFTFSSYVYVPFFPFVSGKWSRIPQGSHSIRFCSCTCLAGDPGQTTLTF